jgi:hypothetical protein
MGSHRWPERVINCTEPEKVWKEDKNKRWHHFKMAKEENKLKTTYL